MIISPVIGNHRISQDYGVNDDIYSELGRRWKIPLQSHNGQDLALAEGTVICAPMDGKVKIGNEPKGYGKYIKIFGYAYNPKGDYREIVLGHLKNWKYKRGKQVFTLKDGQLVRAGDPIGHSGNTGFSSGPHLHWGIRRRNKKGVIYNYDKNLGYEDIFTKGWIIENKISKY